MIRVLAQNSELQAKSRNDRPKSRVAAEQTSRIRTESPRKGTRMRFACFCRKPRLKPFESTSKIPFFSLPCGDLLRSPQYPGPEGCISSTKKSSLEAPKERMLGKRIAWSKAGREGEERKKGRPSNVQTIAFHDHLVCLEA